MNEMLIKTLPNLVSKAEEALTQSNNLLEDFAKEWKKDSANPQADLDSIRMLQLVLQYRLDTQNALMELAKLPQYLRQLLGIEHQDSLAIIMERLSFTLGSDDLHIVLSMLNHLVDSLLRILAHNLQQQSLTRKKALEHLKNQKHIRTLVTVMEKQTVFVNEIKAIGLVLEDIEGAPSPGVVYDSIGALEGPISRFYQALNTGLILAGGLYQQMHRDAHLELHLEDILQKTEHAMHQLSAHPESPRLFAPTVKNTQLERLEERAEAKRLGNFFNH